MTTPEPTENPYAAPRSPVDTGRIPGSEVGFRWRLAWTAVFAVNLIVPFLFASGVVHRTAWVGVGLGIALMFFLGHLLVSRSRRLGFVLVAGAVCVGVSQVVPILQFCAGLFAFGITAKLLNLSNDFDQHGPDLQTGPAGFLTTVFTGGFLMIAAVVSGQVIFLIRRAWKARSV